MTEKDICVTLERPVSIPGSNHRPPQTTVFRARERSLKDDTTLFLGLNIGPDNAVVEVSNDNIRSVAILGGIGDDD